MKYEETKFIVITVECNCAKRSEEKLKKFGEIKTNSFQIVFASAIGNFIVLKMQYSC